jgi:hypothetical protein
LHAGFIYGGGGREVSRRRCLTPKRGTSAKPGRVLDKTGQDNSMTSDEEKKEGSIDRYVQYFFDFRGIFLYCLWTHHAEKPPKTRKKLIEKNTLVFFSQLFCKKVFDMDFFSKGFYGVSELPLLRNAQKCNIKLSKQ